MMRRLSLRLRLTVFVAVVFGAALTITAVAVGEIVEHDLIADTRASAENVLTGYLSSINGGKAALGVVEPGDGTRFFYLDADGNELDEQEYVAIIAAEFDQTIGDTTHVGELPEDAVPGDEVIVGPTDPTIDPTRALKIDPGSGEVLDSTGSAVAFVAGPQPVGGPQRIDVGDGVVGVTQTMALTDGTTFDVGVSSPLQPVTDSLDAIRRLAWFGVPALIAVIAGITWLAATRALRPVHAITGRARAITAANISERVPVHAAQDEIAELATTMNEMLARLEQSQTKQRQFVADASHELRSPVAASRAQLDVATANPDSTDWSATANAVLSEQETLSHLIDDLLALSRIDETATSATEDIDLDDLITSEANRPRPTPVRTSIPAPVRITGNAALVARALRNLVDNAARYANTDVLISLRRHDDQAVINVDDDGPGIPPDQRDRVFQRFARIDEARDRQRGGSGLGLAIAREVARAHHGDLTVSTSPLGGARLTFAVAPEESPV